MVSDELRQKVNTAIESMRPYMQSDGGDLELESISDDLVVTVRFLGSCGSCPYSSMTLHNGVVQAIMHYAPDVKKVVALRENE
jgi:nifU protein, putative